MSVEHIPSFPAQQPERKKPTLTIVPPPETTKPTAEPTKRLPSFSDPEKVKARSFKKRIPWVRSLLMALAMHGGLAAGISQFEKGKDETAEKETKVETFYKVGFHENPEALREEIQNLIEDHGIESIDLATFFMRAAYASADIPKEDVVAAEKAFDKQIDQMRKLMQQSGDPMEVLHELTQPVPQGLDKASYERDQALLPHMILNASGNCEASDARNIAIIQRLLDLGVLDKKNISVKTQVFTDHYQTVVKIGDLMVKLTPPTPTVVSKQDLAGTVLIDAIDHVRMFLGEAVEGTSFERTKTAGGPRGEKVDWGTELQKTDDHTHFEIREKKTEASEQPSDQATKQAASEKSDTNVGLSQGIKTNSIIPVRLAEQPTKAFSDQPVPKQVDYKAAERISRTQAYMNLAANDPAQFEKLATVSPKAMEVLTDRMEKERASSREQAIFDVGMQIHEMGKLLAEHKPESIEKAKEILADIQIKKREDILLSYKNTQVEPFVTFLKENKDNVIAEEVAQYVDRLQEGNTAYEYTETTNPQELRFELGIIEQLIKKQIPILSIEQARSIEDIQNFNTTKLEDIEIYKETTGTLDQLSPDKLKSVGSLYYNRSLTHNELAYINNNMPALEYLGISTDKKHISLAEIRSRIDIVTYDSFTNGETVHHFVNRSGLEVPRPSQEESDKQFWVNVEYSDSQSERDIKKIYYDSITGSIDIEFHGE